MIACRATRVDGGPVTLQERASHRGQRGNVSAGRRVGGSAGRRIGVSAKWLLPDRGGQPLTYDLSSHYRCQKSEKRPRTEDSGGNVSAYRRVGEWLLHERFVLPEGVTVLVVGIVLVR